LECPLAGELGYYLCWNQANNMARLLAWRSPCERCFGQFATAAWGAALLAMAPMLLVYLLHYVAAPQGYHGTGFVQYDQPYYMANAQAVVSHSLSFTYGLPFSPFDDTPRIYSQPMALILGWLLKLSGWDPGAIYVGFGILAGVAMFRIALELSFAYLGKPRDLADWLASMAFLWGGGIVFLAALVLFWFSGLPGSQFWSDSFAFEPQDGYWFLNLGRNAFYATEAFYHLIFLATVLLTIGGRYGWAATMLALMSASHPFTGLELLLVIGSYATLERLVYRANAPPLWFLFLTLGLLLLHLGYYLVIMPHISLEYRLVEKQWSLPWVLPVSTIVVAYAPVMGGAATRFLRRGGWVREFRRAEIRLALVWFAVAFLLANHELFIAPRQPLHFTRGYVWTPLALLALPLLATGFRSLLASHRIFGLAGAAGLLALVTLDNSAWFARCYSRIIAHSDPNAVLLNDGSVAVFHRLAEPDMHDRLVLSEYPMIGYLVTVYVPLRSWLSHRFNTPDANARKAELQTFFATGQLIDAWKVRKLVAVVDNVADPGAVHRLEATGFSIAARCGHAVVLVYDPKVTGAVGITLSKSRREVKVDTRERRPEAATRVWVPLSKSMGLQAPTLEIFEVLSISGLDRTRATSGVGPTKDRSLSARMSASSSLAEGPLRSAVPCRKAVRGLRADVAATDTIAAHCEA